MIVKTILAPGHKLVTHDAQAFCSLGLIVEDQNERLIGLTSRLVLERDSDPRIYDADTEALVGRRIEPEQPEDSSTRQFFELIGAFEIDLKGAAFDPSGALTAGFRILDPSAAIGKTVYKLSGAGERVEAQLIGYGGSVSFFDQHRGREVVYHNVIELEFLDNLAVESANSHEAGSLIFDGQNGVIGLMIASDDHACYAAPLEPFLKALGWSVFDAVEAGDVPVDDNVLEDLSVGYRGAMIGAVQIRSDLRSEGVETPDPYDEPLTKKQLALLEFAA